MIAAIFVDPKGVYSTLDGVQLWGLPDRDARDYAGPLPVVAHPPCARWCRLAGLVEARWGHKKGEDGGCFKHALECVRQFGGVLEHPAYSDAWKAFDLPRPLGHGQWIQGPCGGWAVHIDQAWYGHKAKKATWLYAHGRGTLPIFPQRFAPPSGYPVSWCGNHVKSTEKRPRIGKREASATPPEFAEVLCSIARQCSQ